MFPSNSQLLHGVASATLHSLSSVGCFGRQASVTAREAGENEAHLCTSCCSRAHTWSLKKKKMAEQHLVDLLTLLFPVLN